MKNESLRELKLLEELSGENCPTQRHLAKKLDMALGLANLMIRSCVKKGYIKVINIQKNRIRYLITPKGIAEKTRLTYEYMEYSLYLYRMVRTVLQQTLERISASGGKKVLFFGRGEIAEMAYLTVKETGLELIAVVERESAGAGSFLGTPVIGFDALPGISFDCAIVTSLNGHPEQMLDDLRAGGVPLEKIIMIEREGPRVRALVPAEQVVT